MGRILLEEGDITELSVDAIVNAANTDLKLGSGVAGAIREKGGPEIQAECDRHGSIELGSAAITTAGNLPARSVIHAASMRLGETTSEESLRAATRASFDLAAENGVRSIALPAIGTGVGAVSMQRCAEIMFEEAELHLKSDRPPEEIRFVLFGEPAFRIFEQVQDAARIRAQLERLGR